MIHATTTSKLDRENPWPGLESYEESGHDYFCGREHEAEKLLDKVLDAPVTVLYGRSGLGKTSLLRAGLFPLLRERDFLPIYVRFELTAGAEPFTRQLHDSVRESIQADVPDAMPPSEDESVWEYLHRAGLVLWSARNYPLTPVIVLDQFEELFTLGERFPDRVDVFRNDLGDLAENRITPDLAARIKNDESTAGRFNLRSRNYKLLISLREDFLPHLDEWCRLIPALGRSRMRLLRLREAEALEAVHRPAANLMTEELARRVVSIIAGADLHPDPNAASSGVDSSAHRRGVAEVEPALLSLVCRELNEERKRLEQAQFDESLIEEHGRKTLSNYYSSCVHDLRETVKEFIEDELISEKGFRNFYALEDAVPSRLTDVELAQLISSRLLRLEEHYGAQRIELTHDVLTGVVREHRDRRRAEEEKEQERQAAAQREAELKKRQQAAEALAATEQAHAADLHRRSEILRKLLVVTAIIAVIAVFAAVAAVYFSVTATHARQQAEAARQQAEARTHEAVALSLTSQGEAMLADAEGGGDSRAIEEILAAPRIDPSADIGAEFTAVVTRRDTLKIIQSDNPLLSVALSPDGRLIVGGDRAGALHWWNTDTGQPVRAPTRLQNIGQASEIYCVAFSPDGHRLVSGNRDGFLQIWDADAGHAVGDPIRTGDDAVLSVAFSPNGDHIVSGGFDNTVHLWDVHSGQPVGKPMLRHSDTVEAVAFSPDGHRIVSGSRDNTMQLWSADTGAPLGDAMRGRASDLPGVWAVAFSPHGDRIVAGNRDHTLQIWDANTHTPIGAPMPGHLEPVTGVAFSQDGHRIVSSSNDTTVRLWNADTRQPIGNPMRGHTGPVRSVAFSPNGHRLVSASEDRTARVWNADVDAPFAQPITDQVVDTNAVVFSRDGHRVASGSMDGTVQLWNADTGEPAGNRMHASAAVNSVALSPDGRRIVSGSADGMVQLWDADTGQSLASRVVDGAHGAVNSAAFSPDGGRILAGTQAGYLHLLDLNIQTVGVDMDASDVVDAAAFSRDGHRIVSASWDGAVQLWNADTGKPIGGAMRRHAGPVNAVAISSDGRRIVSGGQDSMLQLWNADTQQPIGDPMRGHTGPVDSVAFSPDGHRIVSGSDDFTLRLWDADKRQPIGGAMTGHTGAIGGVAFSPNGGRVVSGSDDGTMRMWDVPPTETWPVLLCAKLTANMSQKEWHDWVSPQIGYIKICPALPLPENSR